ncbi:DNA N-6-adenine-methyltransferase [Desulfofundulus kuznetsovii DSM 6115]|uniref:DNA N-6-adenine-methyltransferase n=1 Tax=Desulfofundulus kuznetsovii (strain DSM 6115 / VKM B-1805 / 17) TaxID=760568 RepID=A0AAU8PAX9_DESK7|nr:DNA N-6-adenine-methyltransferase [Desulfofundulus kuznetsovii DSM 6115]
MLNESMFSSRTGEWETPQTFFDALDAEFHFTLDVCARPENAKCARFFTPEQDGLRQSWAGETCWMNPPYGREIGRWVEKAYNEARRGAVVVALLPARTDTRWWHRYVMRAAEIRFVEGRLKFGGAENSAPFPSVVVVFTPEKAVSDGPVVRSMRVK